MHSHCMILGLLLIIQMNFEFQIRGQGSSLFIFNSNATKYWAVFVINSTSKNIVDGNYFVNQSEMDRQRLLKKKS